MRVSLKLAVILAVVLALLPALSSAKPADPKGKLVYEDDFSNGTKSGLEDNLKATDYQRGFHPPGVYHLKLLQSNEVRWSLFPKQSYGEFSIALDLWDFSDDITTGSVSQGLVFRAQDSNHFYAVLLDPRNGKYAVRKLDGADKWSDLIAFKASPLVKRQKDVNQLRVDGEGDQFTIYLNDEQLDTFSDKSYAKGGIGFIVANVDAKEPHMHFDNIKIYTTDAQAGAGQTGGAPSSLPKTGEGQGTPAWLFAALALLLLSLGAWARRSAR
jgi:LPXTG-motif cell wall-anchored protein